MFTSAVAANGRNPGDSADFCLIRGELGTGCGEGKSLEHPPGHAGRETGGQQRALWVTSPRGPADYVARF